MAVSARKKAKVDEPLPEDVSNVHNLAQTRGYHYPFGDGFVPPKTSIDGKLPLDDKNGHQLRVSAVPAHYRFHPHLDVVALVTALGAASEPFRVRNNSTFIASSHIFGRIGTWHG